MAITNVLAFAASLRKGSLNSLLIKLAAKIASFESNVKIDMVDFNEFDMPLYNGDIEDSSSLPSGAQKLKAKLESAHALMIASPEYNFSVPGTLKNAIDWVSRARPVAFKDKTVFLLSASPSQVGGNRGLWQLRIPLEGLGAVVCPNMFSLAEAHEAFDELGDLKDPEIRDRLDKSVRSFLRLAQKIAHGQQEKK